MDLTVKALNQKPDVPLRCPTLPFETEIHVTQFATYVYTTMKDPVRLPIFGLSRRMKLFQCMRCKDKTIRQTPCISSRNRVRRENTTQKMLNGIQRKHFCGLQVACGLKLKSAHNQSLNDKLRYTYVLIFGMM